MVLVLRKISKYICSREDIQNSRFYEYLLRVNMKTEENFCLTHLFWCVITVVPLRIVKRIYDKLDKEATDNITFK
jgi:hypothetical protein